jgi:hypothetical protein
MRTEISASLLITHIRFPFAGVLPLFHANTVLPSLIKDNIENSGGKGHG